jgi:hypothetical protein
MASSITIVVADRTSVTDGVRDLIRQWLESDVIEGTVAWLTQEIGAGPVPLISTAGERDVDLMRYLGAQSTLETLRVISLQVIGDVTGHRGVPAHLASTLDSLERHRAPAQRLTSVSVLVPASGVALNRDWLAKPPATNFVAVPEDCATDQMFASPISVEAGLEPHAAFVLAAVAGLWSGVEDNPFELRPGGPGGLSVGHLARTDGVRLIRCYGRVMVCRDVVDESLALVLAQRVDPGFPASNVDALAAPDDFALIDQSARTFADVPECRYSAFVPDALPPRVRVGILQALRSLFTYLWARIRSAPGRVLGVAIDRLHQRVESVTQRVVYGQNSIMKVMGEDRDDSESPTVDPKQYRVWADRLTRQWSNGPAAQPTPQVWVDLRRTGLGLLDGSDLPERLRQPGGARLVVRGPVAVVPDPTSPPPDADILAFGTGTLRPCDPIAAARIDEAISQAIDEVKARRAARAAARADEAEVDKAAEQADEADVAELERLGDIQARFFAWVAPRAQTFLWKVGEDLGQQVAAGTDAFGRALEAGNRIKRDLERDTDWLVKKEEDRLNTKWKRWSIFSGALGLGAVAAFFLIALVTFPILVAMLAFVIVQWLVRCAFAYVMYERNVFKLQYQLEIGLLDTLNALHAVEHTAKEFGRLRSMYEQYLDWAEIIGWIVHHPEGDETIEAAEAAEFPRLVRPRAVEIGIGTISEDHSVRLIGQVARQQFGQGWLNDLYTQYELASMTRWRLRMTSGGGIDPVSDCTDRGARAFLLSEVESGRLAEQWVLRLRDTVQANVGEARPAELFQRVDRIPAEDGYEQDTTTVTEAFFDSVIPVVDTADDPERNPRRFKPAYWTGKARLERNDVNLPDTFVWLPAGLEGRAMEVLPAERVKQLDMEIGEGALRISALRVDVSDEVLVEDLVLFDPAAIKVLIPTGPEPPVRDSGIG